MDHRVVFAPRLGLSPEELVEEWNADSECRATAEARTEPEASTFEGATLAVLGVIAAGVATSAIYDLLKAAVLRLLEKKEPNAVRKRIEVMHIEKDGASLLVLSVEES